jgi:hypothetical protein
MVAAVGPTSRHVKLSITEWEQSLAFDTAAECETFIATRWVKTEKERRAFKLEQYRCTRRPGFHFHRIVTFLLDTTSRLSSVLAAIVLTPLRRSV